MGPKSSLLLGGNVIPATDGSTSTNFGTFENTMASSSSHLLKPSEAKATIGRELQTSRFRSTVPSMNKRY
ncbi:hypothetical protein ACMFMF_009148 [Clarireedia jacksonii]